MSKYKTPIDRRNQIVEAAISIAQDGAFEEMTRRTLADHCEISETLISHYFGDMSSLRWHAIATGCGRKIPSLIVAGLLRKHPSAMCLSEEEKLTALSDA